MYDILEFIPNHYCVKWDGEYDNKRNQDFLKAANLTLKTHLAGYRFIGRTLSDITSEQEIESIEAGLENTHNLNPVRSHLTRALELYSDKASPDYRNSIKESISAVESLSKILTNKSKATLKEALNEIEKSTKLHPAFKNALSQLYGYTSDEGGIRHGLLNDSISS